jgi:ADP-heptose:LPS heptosyltransferase
MNEHLEILKVIRAARADNIEKDNFFSRGIRKIKQLYGYDQSVFSILSYIYVVTIRKTSNRILSMLLGFIKRSTIQIESKPTTVIIAIRITGGVGDCIVVARFLRDLDPYLDSHIVFDIYFLNPSQVDFIFASVPRIRTIIADSIFTTVRQKYDASLTINQYVYFHNEDIDVSRLIRSAPSILKFYSTIEKKRKPYNKLMAHHPSLDGAMSDIAVRLGFSRQNFLHQLAEIKYSNNLLPIQVDVNALDKYSLAGKKYITIHDGWDENFKILSLRPTKAYIFESWILVVRQLKRKFPHLLIVQIGGKSGSLIEGVDINLKGRTSLTEAGALLAGSLLHIDTESGLTHMATALGTKCAVLFGPTNAAFFGYSENINITSHLCGNCWWSTDTWMDFCPRGLAVPECMDSLKPDFIVEKVAEFIQNQLSTIE